MFTILVILIFFGFASYFLVGVFRSYAIKQKLLDHPNSRSSHSQPVPRGGGVVFPVLWSIFLMILYFIDFIEIDYLFIFLPSVFLIAGISFLDDKYKLGRKRRFLVQLMAVIYALIIMDGFHAIDLGVASIYWHKLEYLFVALVLLWSINLYNFMDGIDGIAAIEALFVFGIGGYFIWYSGGVDLAVVIWSMAIIVFGFFLWNKPPAKIFMGDSGSTLLGFLVVSFAILGEKLYNVSFLIWIILYGVFWFDATLTLLRRIIHGEKWYQAHRLHAYQRLQLHNWSHKKIILAVSAINIILASLAFFAFYFPQYVLIFLGMSLVVLLTSYLFVEKAQPMYTCMK